MSTGQGGVGRAVVRNGWGLLVVFSVWLVLAGVAYAGAGFPAKPFTVTSDPNAAKPNLAVDESGTAHVVWREAVPGVFNDRLHYCLISRGARSCSGEQVFELGGEGFANNFVFVPQPGQVVLVTSRCCETDGARLLAFVSSDGGATFDGPRVVGSGVQPTEAAFGPGLFGVSVVEEKTGGVEYQSAALDGFTGGVAKLGAEFGSFQWHDPTVGFPSATVPLSVFTDLKRLYWRLWGGAGEYNDVGTWGSTQDLGVGAEPKLASGPRGAYLMYVNEAAAKDQYRVRRFDGSGFAPYVAVSEKGDPIFRDFAQDRGGNLHAVWVSNNEGAPTRRDPIKYRISTNGETWRPVQTLVSFTNDTAFNLRVGAAGDGGGWAVWDRNSRGPVKAAAIPAVAGGGAGGSSSCPGAISFGLVEARASVGCLKKVGKAYVTSKPVRVNGLDLAPKAGATVSFTPSEGLVAGKKQVTVRAGNVVLDRGSFVWKVPKGAVKVLAARATAGARGPAGANGVSVATFSDLEKFKANLLGFPVVGEAELRLVKGGALIPANLRLPDMFGGVSGKTTLRVANTIELGLDLGSVSIDVPEAFLGALLVRNLHVEYQNDPPVFEGSADFYLPPFYTKPLAKVAFGFQQGKFAHAEGTYVLDPPLPIVPAPVPVSLDAIGLALTADPLEIAGGINLIAGPKLLGSSAISIDALPPNGFRLTLGSPSVLRASGALEIVDIPVAQGFVEYRTSGVVFFGGGASFSGPGLSVSVAIPDGKGFLDLTSGAFSATAKGTAAVFDYNIASASAVLSSKGVAGCFEVPVPKPSITPPEFETLEFGIGRKWTQPIPVPSLGCDLGAFEVTASTSGRALTGTAQAVSLPAGLPHATIAIDGVGGAPLVTVTGPDGVSATAPPAGTVARAGNFTIVPVETAATTYVAVDDPKPGEYQISLLPGSAPIAATRTARGLPEVKVTAKVRGTKRRPRLFYTVRAIPGQTVTFLERSKTAAALIGRAAGAKGTLTFMPALGLRGRRQIVALVEQNGIPREELVVASYIAPRPRPPARPRALRVKRRGASLVARWRTARTAVGYALEAKLSDGQTIVEYTKKNHRTARIRGVARDTRALVTVRSVGPDGGRGPAARATLRAKQAR